MKNSIQYSMTNNQVVKFTQKSRYGEWNKGDLGEIEKVLVLPPANQKGIYIIRLNNGEAVWATDEDFIVWNQLTLF